MARSTGSDACIPPDASIPPGWLAERLAAPARALGVALPDAAWPLLARHASLVLDWGRRVNLTGARSREALADEHLADALALLPHVPPGPARLVDVGSGAGLPGVVLAVARPDLGVTLLEPSQKRYAFLRAVRRALDLGPGRLEVRRERAEAHRAGPAFRPYEVAVARAALPLVEWLRLGTTLVGARGTVLGLEGECGTALPDGAERRPYRVVGRARSVIVLRV